MIIMLIIAGQLTSEIIGSHYCVHTLVAQTWSIWCKVEYDFTLRNEYHYMLCDKDWSAWPAKIEGAQTCVLALKSE